MPKPIEIDRIFGHLDRDPEAVADMLARMPPEEAAQLLTMARVWLGAVVVAWEAVTHENQR